MAGSYADVPNHRLAYDRDGTIVVWWAANTPGTIITLSAASRQALNGERDVGSVVGTWGDGANNQPRVAFLFPAPIALSHYFVSNGATGVSPFDWTGFDDAVRVSTDTTNGQDGTWTSWDAAPSSSTSVTPNYRTEIQAADSTPTVKAVRFALPFIGTTHDASLAVIHLYGIPGDKLPIWHPTLDQRVGPAHFDYGDIAGGGNYSKTFRVKNTHATQTAHAVVVTREALTDKTPSMVGATHLFSIDAGAYATSCAVGDLAPGAISDVITVQRDIPVGAQGGLGAGRYVAQAGSWS